MNASRELVVLIKGTIWQAGEVKGNVLSFSGFQFDRKSKVEL